MVAALSRRGRSRTTRPLFAPASLSRAAPALPAVARSSSATPALGAPPDRQYYERPLSTVVTINRRWAESPGPAGAAAPVIRYEHARPGGARPLGYQEARAHWPHWQPDSRRSEPPYAVVGWSMSRRHRRLHAPRPMPSAPDEKGGTPPRSYADLRLVPRAGHPHAGAADDNGAAYCAESSARSWRPTAFVIGAPDLIGRKRTARPNASSERSCTSGRMRRPIRHSTFRTSNSTLSSL